MGKIELAYYRYEVTFSPYVMTPGEKRTKYNRGGSLVASHHWDGYLSSKAGY